MARSRRNVLGQTLRVNNVPLQIIGVAPPEFFGLQIGEWVDLYAPLAAQVIISPRAKLDRSLGESDSYWWVRPMMRLKQGANEAQAIQELSALFQGLVVSPNMQIEAAKIPRLIATPGNRGFDPLGADGSKALWILMFLVGLILLIVCANVANLLMSRAVARQRESAVCLALGGGRFRLLRRYFIESIVLAAAGSATGMLLSYMLANAIHSFIRTNLGIGGFDLRIDTRMLVFTSLVSTIAALLFGLAPAWHLAKADVNDALKANSRGVLAGRLRLPNFLVVLQIGLSLTVLVAAGLLGRSLMNLESSDLGFDRANVLYVSVNPWRAGYQPERVDQYVDLVRSRLESLPGVSRVGVIQQRPLSGSSNATFVNIPGRPYHQDETSVALVNHVSDSAFETLGIPLLAGRAFDKGDMRARSKVVIVDQSFADHYYKHRDPLGEEFGTGPAPTDHYRIIGVVKNSRYNTLRQQNPPVIFHPMSLASDPGSNVNFVMRSGLNVKQIGRGIRDAIASIDAGVPVVEIKTQTALIDHLLLIERLLRILSIAFGALALTLSVLGLIGLLSYTVARRTNEIGIRMAVGASQADVVRLVLTNSLWLMGLGVVVGLPGAFVIGQILKHTLFNLSPVDPTTTVAAFTILVSAAALATWLPASRAARIDPVAALREE